MDDAIIDDKIIDTNVNKKIEYLKQKSRNLELLPGVYLMKDKKGTVIYVGKAKMLKNRVSSYFIALSSHTPKVLQMVSNVDDFEYIITDSEYEALILENNLIKRYMPKYNILLKDDKGYSYIRLEKGEYPKITVQMQLTDGHYTHLGPYTSHYQTNGLVDIANRVFMLPTCNTNFSKGFKKSRPCLNFHIKKCMGVCSGKISNEAYMENFNQAVNYLKKGCKDILDDLVNKMEEHSNNLEFEKAAHIRDKINMIQKLSTKQKVHMIGSKEIDVFGIVINQGVVCVTVVKYRNALLVDKKDFVFYDALDLNQIYNEFIISFYADNDDIPNTILIEEDFEERELVSNFLLSNLKKRVNLTVASTSEHKGLMELAKKNAYDKLAKSMGRTLKEVSSLEELKNILGLKSMPKYIESYDISNLGDNNIVAGMVVFVNGRPQKQFYKKFKLKTVDSQDDYGSMLEVLSRRLKYLTNENEDTNINDVDDVSNIEKIENEGFYKTPDLILLDGGKGHVSTVLPLIKEMNLSIPVFGMVKDNKHRTRALKDDKNEIAISMVKSVFTLITSIQNEVHRFSNTFREKSHSKDAFSSELTKVKGIGDKKVMKLLTSYKTKKALKDASLEDIKQLIKVPLDVAKELHQKIQEM